MKTRSKVLTLALLALIGAVQLGYGAPTATGSDATASGAGQAHGSPSAPSTPGTPAAPGSVHNGTTTHQGWGPGISPSSTMTAGGNGIGPIVNPSTNSPSAGGSLR